MIDDSKTKESLGSSRFPDGARAVITCFHSGHLWLK